MTGSVYFPRPYHLTGAQLDKVEATIYEFNFDYSIRAEIMMAMIGITTEGSRQDFIEFADSIRVGYLDDEDLASYEYDRRVDLETIVQCLRKAHNMTDRDPASRVKDFHQYLVASPINRNDRILALTAFVAVFDF